MQQRLARDQNPERRGVAFRVSDLSDVGADGQFTGMAFDKMRRPGTKRAQHAGVENVSRSFHAHREPQQFTRFGSPRNNFYSR
jgi:hypothetical protein